MSNESIQKLERVSDALGQITRLVNINRDGRAMLAEVGAQLTEAIKALSATRPAETGSEGKVERLRNALQPFAVAASTIAHQKLPAPFSLGYWTEPRPTAVPGVDLPQFVAVLKYEKRHFDEALAAMEATDDWTPTPSLEDSSALQSARGALEAASRALKHSYDATEWPATPDCDQLKAAALCDSALALLAKGGGA